MLQQAPSAPKLPSFEQMVETLLREDRQLSVLERRSYHRQPLVRPVHILPTRGQQKPIVGFSKNISPAGIGILTMRGLPEKLVAKLQIHRMNEEPFEVLSECRWCDEFGDGWFMAGWNFLNLC